MKGDRLVIRELNKNLGLLLITINQLLPACPHFEKLGL